MQDLSSLIASISGIAWPATLLIVLMVYKRDIKKFLEVAILQFRGGAALKWKDFEFRGIDIFSSEKKITALYRREPADLEIYLNRKESYRKNKNIFLVHRVIKTDRINNIVNKPVFDISVYLVGHKSYGRINDIREVEYYFGHYFGKSQGEHGTKYIISNGSEGFAVKIEAYGPTLCEARIKFHDNSEANVNRYLDFEGTDYEYIPIKNHIDVMKVGKSDEDVN